MSSVHQSNRSSKYPPNSPRSPRSPRSPWNNNNNNSNNSNSNTNSNNSNNQDMKDSNKRSHGRSRSFEYVVMNKKTFSPKPKAQHRQQSPKSPRTLLIPEMDQKPPTFDLAGNLEAAIETPRTPRGERGTVGVSNNGGIVGGDNGTGAGDLNSISSFGNYSSIQDRPTELHKAVASKTTTISQLRTHLLARPSAASIKDSAGRLPLHLISLNKELFSYHLQSQSNGGDKNESLAAFIMELFLAYPMAAIQYDSEGRLPFTYALHDWIDSAHDRSGSFTSPSSVGADLITTNLNNRPESITTSSIMSKKQHHQHSSQQRHGFSSFISGGNKKDYSDHKKKKNPFSPSETQALKGSTSAHSTSNSRRYRNSMLLGKPQAPPQQNHSNNYQNLPQQQQYWQNNNNREGGSVATATISNMDGSASLAGWSMDDTIPENVRVDKMAHWNFYILTKLIDQLHRDAMSGRNLDVYMAKRGAMANSSGNQFGTVIGGGGGGGGNGILGIDPLYILGGDQASISTKGTGVGGGAVSPPKMLRIASSNNNIPDIGRDPSWLANILISGVASIPSILKIILVISEDDPRRDEIMSFSIVKAILRSHYSIGNWLVHMLEHPSKSIYSAAVDYLELISSHYEDEKNAASSKRNNQIGLQSNSVKDRSEKDQLFTKVGNLDYFVITLLALKDSKNVKRGASTQVVQHIVNWKLTTTPVLIIALSDLLFHLILIVLFQYFSNLFLNENGKSKEGVVAYYMTLIAILYLLIRKLSHFAVMIKMSWHSFFRYCFRFLDILDVTTLTLTLSCLIMMEIGLELENAAEHWLREVIAITTVFVWGKFLGFMYIVNLDVKFFICAIGQNFKNIRWMLLLLAICIFSFSQSMHVILSSPLICSEDNSLSYCNENSYIQSYSIIFGVFDEGQFTSTIISSIFFVLFSFFTTLILVASIVAITVKTFAALSDKQPYGDTRLIYFAEVKAFQRLISGQWSLVQYCAIVLFLSSVAAAILLSVASMKEVLLKYHDDSVVRAGTIVLWIFVWVSILAFLNHLTFYDFIGLSASAEENATRTLSRRRVSSAIRWVTHFFSAPMRFVVREFLGISERNRDDISSMFQSKIRPTQKDERKDDDLRTILGEMNRMEKEMKDIQNRSKIEIMAQMRSMIDSDSFMGKRKKDEGNY